MKTKLILIILVMAGIAMFFNAQRCSNFQKGNEYYVAKKYDLALNSYTESINEYPNHMRSYLGRASTLIKMDKVIAAQKDIDFIISNSVNDRELYDAYIQKFHIYNDMGNQKEAYQYIKKLLSNHTRDSKYNKEWIQQFLHNYESNLFKSKLYKEAYKVNELLINYFPSDEDALMVLAYLDLIFFKNETLAIQKMKKLKMLDTSLDKTVLELLNELKIKGVPLQE